jgi:hypothetical protein
MPEYKQTVRFEREFVIKAKDAREANEKLEELIRSAEWDADVRADGWEDFEDLPVECQGAKVSAQSDTMMSKPVTSVTARDACLSLRRRRIIRARDLANSWRSASRLGGGSGLPLG